MKCPNCYSPVPGGADKCPRCDWSFRAPAAPTSSAAFADSPTADPWGNGSSAAPTWTPEPQQPQSAWDAAPPVRTDSQGYWDSSAKANWGAAPPGGPAAGGSLAGSETSWLNPNQQSGGSMFPSNQQSGGAMFPTNQAGGPLGSVPPPAFGQTMPFTPPTVVSTVPLTGGQKAQLWLAGVAPLAIMGVFGAVIANMFSRVGGIGIREFPWFFPLMLGVLIIFFVYQAVQNIRDASSGTANVQTDRLTRTSRVRSKNSVTYYAHFANLGKMKINRALFNNATDGAIYNVTYSPATKRIWAMQPGG